MISRDKSNMNKAGRRSASIPSLVLALLVMLFAACAPAAALVPNPSNTPPATLAAAPTTAATTSPSASVTAPKAYVGLFQDNAIAVIDTATQRVLRTISIPAGPHGLVITPDGHWVYASSDGDSKVSVIDTTIDQVAKTIEVGKSPHGLAITPDGRQVLVADFGTSMVVFIDTASNQVTGQVAVPSPHNIAISPDGRTAYVAAQKQGAFGLAVIDVNGKTQTANIPLDKTPRALNFSPDGKQIYFTLAGLDAVQVLDTASNKIMAQIPVGASPHHPLFTSDGKTALVVSQGPGELAIIDPSTHTIKSTVKVGKMPHWIALTPDNQMAFVTNEVSSDISVVDISAGKVTATMPVGNAPRKIIMQPGPMKGAQAGTQASIAGMAFPSSLTVAAGQPITWTNDDSVNHTVTSDNGLWDSGQLAPGHTFTLTLTKPGTYTYHCSNHPFMQGTIVVQG